MREDTKTASELNNPSVLPSASHLPLHRGGYNKATPCGDETVAGDERA